MGSEHSKKVVIKRKVEDMNARSSSLKTRKAFQTYDADKSGYVEKNEAQKVLREELSYNDDQIDTLFKTFDRNKDQKLSYEEFVDFHAAVSEK